MECHGTPVTLPVLPLETVFSGSNSAARGPSYCEHGIKRVTIYDRQSRLADSYVQDPHMRGGSVVNTNWIGKVQ